MKIKRLNFKWLLQKVKDTFNTRSPQYAEIPAGGCALIFENQQAYTTLINALADAETFTGLHYIKKVLSKSTIIKN